MDPKLLVWFIISIFLVVGVLFLIDLVKKIIDRSGIEKMIRKNVKMNEKVFRIICMISIFIIIIWLTYTVTDIIISKIDESDYKYAISLIIVSGLTVFYSILVFIAILKHHMKKIKEKRKEVK